jgi:hypothetical protein
MVDCLSVLPTSIMVEVITLDADVNVIVCTVVNVYDTSPEVNFLVLGTR